jgi:hypothetical protein
MRDELDQVCTATINYTDLRNRILQLFAHSLLLKKLAPEEAKD